MPPNKERIITQRDKIFIRTNKNFKTYKKRVERKPLYVRINKFIKIRAYLTCPYCQCNKLYGKREYKRTVIDLKIFDSGVKKWIVQYSTVVKHCPTCRRELVSTKFKKTRGKYGFGLKCWVIYQNIANGQSFFSISKNLKDLFNLEIDSHSLIRFKTDLAEYYLYTYKKLINNIVRGRIIHADETSVNLREKVAYVWVFTNMEEVVFLFKLSREGGFLKKFLKAFNGVLISDFYAAYNSVECPQQKCLVHLIRDLNEDILKFPYDIEFKDAIQQFAKLLKKIIKTIDKYGLRKRNLNKHKKDVQIFFKNFYKLDSNSELIKKYKKRFEKTDTKLFTFLNYDGVPWNNNNAEHAIKHFAMYRKNADGLFTEKGTEQYLILLSVYQTCKYRNINFLQFLLSERKDVNRYMQ